VLPHALHRLAPAFALLLLHCSAPEPNGPRGSLAIEVAPLDLSGVTDVDYVLTVHNGAAGTGEVVWTRALSSGRYGDGAGSLSYVGTCDASTAVNTVTLELVTLRDVTGEVPATTYMNPTPVTREVHCVEDADVAVQFDVTMARRAEQGFFDVAVEFTDIFCAAKLDCQSTDGSDLELLHAPDGARGMTVVLGFACTASITGGATYLYLDDLVVRCEGETTPVRVAPVGLGSVVPVANPGGYLFGAAVYRGVEALAGKAYWNVALGLAPDTFLHNGACTLTTRATASTDPFPQEALGFPTPADAVYPVITWSVPLSDADGRVCRSHAVDAGTEVVTRYAGVAPFSSGPVYLQHRFQPIHPPDPAGEVLSAGAPLCASPCTHGVCALADGVAACDCTGTGYDGPTCDDAIDACAVDNGGCGTNAVCTTTGPGTRTCACTPGYADYDGDGSCVLADGCLAILLDAPSAPSGVYTVDPDGAGAQAAFPVYCDMTTDGGGWTLIANRRAGANNTEACGSSIRTFFNQASGCGSPTAVGASDSFALSKAQRTSLHREEMLVQQLLDGAFDEDDAYIVTVPATTGDLFPDTATLTDFVLSGVCAYASGLCDTTTVRWRYIGDMWFASAYCNAATDPRYDYRGNYGLCHNGATAVLASSFTGDRSGYDETKLWGVPTSVGDYQERIWYR